MQRIICALTTSVRVVKHYKVEQWIGTLYCCAHCLFERYRLPGLVPSFSSNHLLPVTRRGIQLSNIDY